VLSPSKNASGIVILLPLSYTGQHTNLNISLPVGVERARVLSKLWRYLCFL